MVESHLLELCMVIMGAGLHCGCPNLTPHWRSLIYIVFAGKFFEQGRDPLVEAGLYSTGRPVGTAPQLLSRAKL
jgi:hypothetical protein